MTKLKLILCKSRIFLLIIVMFGAFAPSSWAETSINAQGAPGTVFLPSAYTDAEGETRFTYYEDDEKSAKILHFQAFDRLNLSAHFSDSQNFGSENSIGLHLQLFNETASLPAIALGFQDFMGNSPYSAEYLVASKRFSHFETSLGVGWGALSGKGLWFKDTTRPEADSHILTTDALFKGPASPFAGLVYNTPIKGISLAADYLPSDGGDFSYALRYQPSPGIGIQAYSFGDEKIGFAVSLSGNPNRPHTAQDSFQPPLTVVPRDALGLPRQTGWENTPANQAISSAITQILNDDGFKVHAISLQDKSAKIAIKDSQTLQTPLIFGRAIRALAMSTPGSVESFTVQIVNAKNIPVSELTMSRSDYEKMLESDNRALKSWKTAKIQGATAELTQQNWVEEEQSALSFGFGPRASAQFFDSNGQIEINPYFSARYEATKHLFINGRIGINPEPIFGNAQPASITSAQPIRSDISHYQDKALTLERLTADYFYKIGRSLYGRMSFGLLETQYGGVSGEWIYASPNSRFAYGLDIAQVKKRSANSPFEFDDYETTTGFATLYWDTGIEGIETHISYGKFLGGDWGSGFALARKFRNGWRVATELTIPDSYFSSKDTREIAPSLQVSIPLQWSMPRPTQSRFDLGISGGISDTGARLNISNPLYETIETYDKSDYEMRWGAFWQ